MPLAARGKAKRRHLPAASTVRKGRPSSVPSIAPLWISAGPGDKEWPREPLTPDRQPYESICLSYELEGRCAYVLLLVDLLERNKRANRGSPPIPKRASYELEPLLWRAGLLCIGALPAKPRNVSADEGR